MYTIEHEFYPGEEVFVVLDKETVKHGTVIQVTVKLFEDESTPDNLSLTYLILLDNLNTKEVAPSSVFYTSTEALDHLEQFLS